MYFVWNMCLHSIETVVVSAQIQTKPSTLTINNPILLRPTSTKRYIDVSTMNDNNEQHVVPLFLTDDTRSYNINNIQNEWFLMDLE